MESAKPLTVVCPCCKATITIDPVTGDVLTHKEAKRELQSMEEFLEKQKTRSQDLDAKFRERQEREKHRKEELERKFQMSRDAHKDDTDLPKRGPLWD